MVEEERRLRVGISGSYGGMNLGDEAILHVILTQLRRSLPVELTVFSRNPEDTRRRHEVDHVVQLQTCSRRETRDLVAGLDLFILGGGGILYDLDADMYLREVFLAVEAGIPLLVYAVGAGPLTDPRVRSRVREALNQAALITVRDRQSQRLLEDLGVEHDILVTADPAVLLEEEHLPREELVRAEALEPGRRLVAFSIREPGPAAPELVIEHEQHLIANAADFVVDRLDADVVFIPLELRNEDLQHSHRVISMMWHARRATVLRREYSPAQCISLLRHFELTVGMRLHFLIFSALAGRPFVALPYASKVAGFLEALKLPPPPVHRAGVGELLAQIDRTWDRREELTACIQAGMAELKRRARTDIRFALSLLRHIASPELLEQEDLFPRTPGQRHPFPGRSG